MGISLHPERFNYLSSVWVPRLVESTLEMIGANSVDLLNKHLTQVLIYLLRSKTGLSSGSCHSVAECGTW